MYSYYTERPYTYQQFLIENDVTDGEELRESYFKAFPNDTEKDFNDYRYWMTEYHGNKNDPMSPYGLDKKQRDRIKISLFDKWYKEYYSYEPPCI